MLHIWKKAQRLEEKFYREIFRHESADYWRKFIYRSFKVSYQFFEGKDVLEIGCGSHGMIHYLDEPSLAVGIDPLCTLYRDVYSRRDRRVMHITGVGECLPLRGRVFDIVVCINVLDHGIDPEDTIREIRRVLKQDGKLLLLVNTFTLPKSLRSVLWILDRTHPHHLSENDVYVCLHNVLKVDSCSSERLNLFSYFRNALRSPDVADKRRYILLAFKDIFALIFGRMLSAVCSKCGSQKVFIDSLPRSLNFDKTSQS